MKSMFSNSAIRIFLILSLLLIPAQLFAAKNVLTVACVDQTGKPIKDAKVQIYHLQTNKWKDKKSDAKGIANFDKLDDGAYHVVSRLQGYSPALYVLAMLKEDARQEITLRFEPGPTERKLYFEDQTVAALSTDTLMEGLQALQEQKYSEAENKMRVALQLNPSIPDAHMNLAIALIQQAKWDEAGPSLKEASRTASALAELQRTRNPEVAAALEQMRERAGSLLQKLPALKMRMAASDDLAKRDFDSAIAKYREILKSMPDDSDAYYNLALAFANAERYDESTAAIDGALQLRPNEPDYVKLKEQIADHRENYQLKQARVILEEADKLVQQSQYAAAIAKYEQTLPLLAAKNQAVVYFAMGGAYSRMDQTDKAVENFKHAIERAPDNGNYRKALGQHYMNHKQYDEALKVFAEAQGPSSGPPDQALMELAKQMSQQGNNQVALLALEKALEHNPQNADVNYELGMQYYYDKVNDARAKELLTKYLELGKDEGKLDNVRKVLVVIQKRIK